MKYINYREERNHGTIDFPIEFYHVTPNHPRYDNVLSLAHRIRTYSCFKRELTYVNW